MEVAPKKEKRGRKPKNNISTQKVPKIVNKVIGTKIIHIKPAKHEDADVDGYDQGEPIFDTMKPTESKVCWNCHRVSHEFIGMPVSRINRAYVVHGSFCSPSCSARYIYDTYENKELWIRYNLLNMYYNETRSTHGKKVTPAPHRHQLLEYGGNMTREEYHGRSSHSERAVILPPIIPIDNSICDLESNVHCKSTGGLKLYRKKPIKTNHVLEKMNET